MISSNWETPLIQNQLEKKVVSLQQSDVQAQINKTIDKIYNLLLNKEAKIKKPKQLNLFAKNAVYDPNGPIPLPKTFDLDDQQSSIKDILAKHGIVCPGAESVKIEEDPLDPLVTVITIKKTIF